MAKWVGSLSAPGTTAGLLLGAPGILIAIIFVIPLAGIILMSLTEEPVGLQGYLTFFTSSGYVNALVNTLRIGIIVTVLCVILGFPYAWCMVHAGPVVRGLLIAALMIPMWTSMLVRTYAWLIILNPQGIINKALMGMGVIEQPLTLVHNLTGVLVGMTQILLPLFVLPLFAVMHGYDQRLTRAAQSLGARPSRAFMTVFVPAMTPGLVAGSLLVFIVAIGFFITPSLLGSPKETMISEVIQTQFSTTLDWKMGSTMATILLIVTFVLLAIAARIGKLSKLGA